MKKNNSLQPGTTVCTSSMYDSGKTMSKIEILIGQEYSAVLQIVEGVSHHSLLVQYQGINEHSCGIYYKHLSLLCNKNMKWSLIDRNHVSPYKCSLEVSMHTRMFRLACLRQVI